MNFVVLEPPTKFFSTKFGRAIPTYDRFSIPRKFSPQNDHSYQSTKVFSLESYTVCICMNISTDYI